MRKTKYLIYLSLVALIGTLILVNGCRKTAEKAEEKAENITGTAETQARRPNLELLINQWDSSRHSQFVQYPNGEDKCILCHNGDAYAKEIGELAKIPDGKKVIIGGPVPGQPAPKTPPTVISTTPTNCVACHTGKGLKLIKAGVVDTPTLKAIKSGKSAVCISCHNGRRVPDINDKTFSAPHPSAQSDEFYASGGIKPANVEIKESGHLKKLKDKSPCTTCHMPKKENQASHEFKMNKADIKQTCRMCHKKIGDTFNPPAKGDYDGNGKKEGIQDEVTSLLDMVKTEIGRKLAGGSFTSKGGKFVFTNKAGKPLTTVPKEVYLATYNYQTITNDGSKGVHNPTFAVKMLQQSYKALTGKDVPKATLK